MAFTSHFKAKIENIFSKARLPAQVIIYSTFSFPVFGDILTFQLISDIFYDCFGFEKYSMGGDLVLPKYIKTPTDILKSKHSVSRLELYIK